MCRSKIEGQNLSVFEGVGGVQDERTVRHLLEQSAYCVTNR